MASGLGGNLEMREKSFISRGCFALDALRPKTYYFDSRMVKSAGSASARKSEMNIFRLFYSPQAAPQTPF